MKKIAYLVGYAVAFAVIFYASSALAATPQEILNQTLANYDSDSGMNMSGDMNMDLVETISDNSYYNGPQKVSFSMNFAQRSLPKDDEGYQNGEGYFRINKMYIEDETDVFTISDPLAIYWRIVKPDMYVKVGQLPESLKNQLIELGADLSPITQRWFTFDAPKDEGINEILPPIAPGGVDPTDKLFDMFKNLGDKQFLQVLSTEKRYKNTKGEDMVRVRVGINRNVLYREYQAELNEAYKIKDYKARTEAIKTARDEYNENLIDARALHMAANINVTNQRLERIEFGLTQTKDKEDCDWNDDFTNETCRVVGETTVKFSAGVWLSEANHSQVYIPYNAMTMDEMEGFFAEALGL
ncbi:MAG: hypothetical protein P1P90_00970 [Patescibacteria group bacterium]|nr:hypothetical protein [Patescibacteria group bacterium]